MPRRAAAAPARTAARWLLLLPQLPPRPSQLRVAVWRRLQALGAVALKNAVWVLPAGDQSREDFEWLLREIRDRGGDAALCEASWLDGLDDARLEALFVQARQAEYGQLRDEARRLLAAAARATDRGVRRDVESRLGRLRRGLRQTAAIDHFGAPGQQSVQALLDQVEARIQEADVKARGERRPAARAAAAAGLPAAPAGATWVTRQGVKVDRIASAWLIRRFIDSRARLKFVAGPDYRPRRGELRYDMFEAEYTHEGELCTFEVLLRRFGLRQPGLQAIAEIVHDIDLKDGRYGREETPGIARTIAAIVHAHPDDERRVERGAALLDDLHALYASPPAADAAGRRRAPRRKARRA